ncbi:Alanine racemase [Variovorax sp. SRS16]|uniref:alanine racemase n=1 Tax=Variovorax sp. SRS16 TaxID=282217 RepID=UPI001318326E|nr:alanine racemase [Variovorax sp. SRS16]VTU26503.1 Alanine racemase [Variovorax sp. SRS16]
MSRPARALIDLDALRHNHALARVRHGGRVLAVLKANAYGHGALRCAQALEAHADGFAVAFLDEALALRAGGIRAPMLVLEGVFTAQELEAAQAHGLWTVVHHDGQLQMIEKSRPAVRDLNVWLKVDSGMRRAGFAPHQVRDVHARLRGCGKVARLTLMSHFACADEPGAALTREQIACFDEATAGLAGERSLSNSAGVLAWPQANRDWARPGILLYGANPVPDDTHALRPVMRLQSQVFAERTLRAGDVLGYGASFVASRQTRVGLVAMGYADGYPRTAPTGTPVRVGERMTRTLGRVSMDMMTVDLSELPDVGIGSEVELWGDRVAVNTVARGAGTIAYELLCNVKRVPLVYREAAAPHAQAR